MEVVLKKSLIIGSTLFGQRSKQLDKRIFWYKYFIFLSIKVKFIYYNLYAYSGKCART